MHLLFILELLPHLKYRFIILIFLIIIYNHLLKISIKLKLQTKHKIY